MTTSSCARPAPYRENPPHRANRSSPAAADAMLEFGRFRVLLRRRQLIIDGVPMELGLASDQPAAPDGDRRTTTFFVDASATRLPPFVDRTDSRFTAYPFTRFTKVKFVKKSTSVPSLSTTSWLPSHATPRVWPRQRTW